MLYSENPDTHPNSIVDPDEYRRLIGGSITDDLLRDVSRDFRRILLPFTGGYLAKPNNSDNPRFAVFSIIGGDNGRNGLWDELELSFAILRDRCAERQQRGEVQTAQTTRLLGLIFAYTLATDTRFRWQQEGKDHFDFDHLSRSFYSYHGLEEA